jgi:hypothetical protein
MFRTFLTVKRKNTRSDSLRAVSWISKLPFLMTPFVYATPFQEDMAIHKRNTMIIRAPTNTCIITY